MTTNKFIEMLQKADPRGNAHVRLPEGTVPYYAELKEGYWDGPYSYINENDEWVYSTMGDKVDIHCISIDDFVSNKVSSYHIPEWEKIKNKFKFELSYSLAEHRNEREDAILEEAKESYDSSVDSAKFFEKEGIERALKNEMSGWTWFQNMLVDDKSLIPNLHHFYTWKVFDETGKEQSSNLHNVEAICMSGLFRKVKSETMQGYYQWIKI